MRSTLGSLRERAPTERPVSGQRVLVVAEDPVVIEEVRSALREDGPQVVGCLGPAHSHCPLLGGAGCQISHKTQWAIVVSPPSGAFHHHYSEIQAGEYAEILQRHRPEMKVLLCGAPVGRSGPAGEVLCVDTLGDALTVSRLRMSERKGERNEA